MDKTNEKKNNIKNFLQERFNIILVISLAVASLLDFFAALGLRGYDIRQNFSYALIAKYAVTVGLAALIFAVALVSIGVSVQYVIKKKSFANILSFILSMAFLVGCGLLIKFVFLGE